MEIKKIMPTDICKSITATFVIKSKLYNNSSNVKYGDNFRKHFLNEKIERK